MKFNKKQWLFSARQQALVSKALSEAGVDGNTAIVVMHAMRRAYTTNKKTIKIPTYHVGKIN
jgi:hypothetical protein